MFRKKNKIQEPQNSSSSVPFIFGFVAGITAGLLVAPDKGSVTRKNLKKKINSLIDDFKETETYEEIKSNPKVQEVTDKVKDIASKAKTVTNLVENKVGVIAKSPKAKTVTKLTNSVSKTAFKSLKNSINKKTGKKFIAKKK